MARASFETPLSRAPQDDDGPWAWRGRKLVILRALAKRVSPGASAKAGERIKLIRAFPLVI